ncbi:alcohol dehydrogenase catalytic domain-containing protein [Clostridium boliviensis]|uniref:Alcohol dehydrogenase catalytic domain-containing protein n=1 Tax=Clostridium boliviensis TaxID=318465 RepID=A0ABU4GHV6_9CLOT|nr:alcohol dehydrogenase catalytic domain-containing protein [Clostridium boliviensis]MDW2796612.1 alcohol dehydrogenase catalytic domain-containing protein [Clostridium boliviensis]
MKSCVITSPFHYEIREIPIPEPGDNEVLIQMKSAGVCGSDLHIYRGENPCSTYPLVPGHENAGIVAKTGKNVTNVKVGDHVVVDLIITCGECYQCTHGREEVCENVLVRGSGTDGGWREYFTAPGDDVYKIENTIPWKDAALIEPVAIGAHCTKRGRIESDDTVIILGTGTIGTIILQACKVIGAKVICCDIDDESLKRAKAFGADEIINSKTENISERISQITGGHGCTAAFDSACFPGSLTLLLQPGIVCNAGRVIPMGFSDKPESFSQADINKRELDIIGSRMSAYQFQPVAKNMAEGKYQLEGLATTFVKFNEIEKVFKNMENPDPTVKKTVILFD